MIRLAAVLTAVGAVCAAWAPVLPVAYLGFAVLGFGVSVVAPMAFSYVGRNVGNRARTGVIAQISMIGYTGFFIGPPVMGFVSEAIGLGWSFAAMGAALLVITFVLAPLLVLAVPLADLVSVIFIRRRLGQARCAMTCIDPLPGEKFPP